MKLVKGVGSKGHRLYELTRQDLSHLVGHDYQVGNILIFSSDEKPRIGREIGRANTLRAAKSFLADLEQLDLSFPLQVSEDLDDVRFASGYLGENSDEYRSETALPTAGTQELQARIGQLARENVELRAELAEKSQRVKELSFRSLQDDLRHQELMQSLTSDSSDVVLDAIAELDELRVETLTLRKGLSSAEGRCAELESANVLLAAEQTTLLCELDAVQKALDAGNRLQGFGGQLSTAGDPGSDTYRPGSGASCQPPGTASPSPDLGWQSQDSEQELVLTNPKGDVIHIYHEFPEIPRSSLRRKLFSRARQLLFILTGMAVAAYVFYLNSVLDTMKASGVDIAPYSKAVLDALLKPFGL